MAIFGRLRWCPEFVPYTVGVYITEVTGSQHRFKIQNNFKERQLSRHVDSDPSCDSVIIIQQIHQPPFVESGAGMGNAETNQIPNA